MSTSHITTLLALLLSAGCARRIRGQLCHPTMHLWRSRKKYVMVQGANDKVWYSGHQLIGIARRYAEEQKLTFNFEGTEKIVWVNPVGRVRADVWFSSEMGQPVLHVAIDKYGKVIRRDSGTAVCGTGQK